MQFVVKDLGLCDYDKALLSQKNTRNQLIKNLAPKVVEGVDKLKKWSESL